MPRGYVKPSLTERLETIAELEGLEGYTETVEFLVREYNTFPPGYPGGYVRLRREYAAHLEAGGARSPDEFLAEKGVLIGRVREEWGRYAARRLAPLEEAYRDSLDREGSGH